MQRRYLYVLMFSVPALLASLMLSVAVLGAAAGVLWVAVYGDDPWPASVNTALIALFSFTCVVALAACLYVAYATGRNEEASAGLNGKHMAVSIGATVVLVVLIAAHQWGVGNIGTPSDGALCSDFCRTKGYAGSGMPPKDSGIRTCSCFDAQGREAIKVPMR
jgi:Na+-driven multidrug efflux pump